MHPPSRHFVSMTSGPAMNLEFVPSISRNSGLQADGETCEFRHKVDINGHVYSKQPWFHRLKDHVVQKNYWNFVLGKARRSLYVPTTYEN